MEPLYISGGNAKYATTVENGLVVPQKIKHRLTTGPSHSTPKYIPKRSENRYSHTCTQMFMTILVTTNSGINLNVHQRMNAHSQCDEST